MIDWYPPSSADTDGLGGDPAQLEAGRRIERFMRAVAKRYPLLARHSERTAVLASAMAEDMGWSAADRQRLQQATLLHDVGMIHVPQWIVSKRTTLSPDEFERVKEHSRTGAAMVADVLDSEQVSWVRHHHERPDGLGYPDRLSAGRLPEPAAIIAIADAWIAMTAGRPHRPAVSADQALAECWRHAGRQFTKGAVRQLLTTVERTGGLANGVRESPVNAVNAA